MKHIIRTTLISASILFLSSVAAQADSNLYGLDTGLSYQSESFEPSPVQISLTDGLYMPLEDGWSLQFNKLATTDANVRRSYADNAAFSLDEKSSGMRVGFSLKYRFK